MHLRNVLLFNATLSVIETEKYFDQFNIWFEMIADLCHKLIELEFEVLNVTAFTVEIKPIHSERVAVVNLSNLRRRINVAEKEDEKKIIDDFCIRIANGFVDSNSHQKPTIFPRIIAHSVNKSLSAPWSKPLLSTFLDLILIADYGKVMKQIQPIQLVSMGKSIPTLMAEAMQNLSSIDVQPTPTDNGGLLIHKGDGHDAARVLLSLKQWPHMKYAAIPSRDSLWLLPSQPDSKTQKSVALAYQKSAYPIFDKWILIESLDFN